MNIQRLEMMRVMLERVFAGSWEPDQSIGDEVYRPNAMPMKVEGLVLRDWRKPTNALTRSDENYCGFSACAVGHACFDEEFRKLGWSWKGSVPSFGPYFGWSAVAKFFEFPNVTYPSDQLGELLFGSFCYSTKIREKYKNIPFNIREAKMVADRIAYLIKHGPERTRSEINAGNV